jgi:hypothetical protein
MDVDAPVGQHARLTVDPTDRRCRSDDAFETLARDRHCHEESSPKMN